MVARSETRSGALGAFSISRLGGAGDFTMNKSRQFSIFFGISAILEKSPRSSTSRSSSPSISNKSRDRHLPPSRTNLEIVTSRHLEQIFISSPPAISTRRAPCADELCRSSAARVAHRLRGSEHDVPRWLRAQPHATREASLGLAHEARLRAPHVQRADRRRATPGSHDARRVECARRVPPEHAPTPQRRLHGALAPLVLKSAHSVHLRRPGHPTCLSVRFFCRPPRPSVANPMCGEKNIVRPCETHVQGSQVLRRALR